MNENPQTRRAYKIGPAADAMFKVRRERLFRLGERLSRLIAEDRISTLGLARRIGVTHMTLYGAMNKTTRRPQMKTIDRIESFLKGFEWKRDE